MNPQLQAIYEKAVEKQNQNKKDYFEICKQEAIKKIEERLTHKDFKQFPIQIKIVFKTELELTVEEKVKFGFNFASYLSVNKINNSVKYIEKDNTSYNYADDYLLVTIKEPTVEKVL